jgi:hypothetical protein
MAIDFVEYVLEEIALSLTSENCLCSIPQIPLGICVYRLCTRSAALLLSQDVLIARRSAPACRRTKSLLEYAEVASSERKGKKRFACGEKSGNIVRATVGKRVAGQICTLITYRVSQSLHYETLRTGGGYSSTHFFAVRRAQVNLKRSNLPVTKFGLHQRLTNVSQASVAPILDG